MLELKENYFNERQEQSLLVDISKAPHSSKACQLVDEFIAQLPEATLTLTVDLNVGDLLLTKGILVKIKQQFQKAGVMLGTIYSTVPQTQQAALDEGLYVKGKLQTQWAPIRQPLPLKTSEHSKTAVSYTIETNATSKKVDSANIDLPSFTPGKKNHEFTTVPLPSSDVPELAEAKVEEISTENPIKPSMQIENTDEACELEQQEVELPDTAFDTLYLRQTLRSGQTVRFNGNVIIVGDVHAGSEITAGGDIVVWGELRGIAHAGAQGNFKAEIRAMKIEALQLRIADYIARRPDRIYYHKDGTETIVSPETARVADGEIKIFKTLLSKN